AGVPAARAAPGVRGAAAGAGVGSRGQVDGDRRRQAPRVLPDQRIEVGDLRPRPRSRREVEPGRRARRARAGAGARGVDRGLAGRRRWQVTEYRNPKPTVDVVIELADAPGKIVFIVRRNEPRGLALPGGFIDEGEWVADAAV